MLKLMDFFELEKKSDYYKKDFFKSDSYEFQTAQTSLKDHDK